jgi:hypothetical protein
MRRRPREILRRVDRRPPTCRVRPDQGWPALSNELWWPSSSRCRNRLGAGSGTSATDAAPARRVLRWPIPIRSILPGATPVLGARSAHLAVEGPGVIREPVRLRGGTPSRLRITRRLGATASSASLLGPRTRLPKLYILAASPSGTTRSTGRDGNIPNSRMSTDSASRSRTRSRVNPSSNALGGGSWRARETCARSSLCSG